MTMQNPKEKSEKQEVYRFVSDFSFGFCIVIYFANQTPQKNQKPKAQKFTNKRNPAILLIKFKSIFVF